jgi:hypothetical protein
MPPASLFKKAMEPAWSSGPGGALAGQDWAVARRFGFRLRAPMYRATRNAVDPAGQRETIQTQGTFD